MFISESQLKEIIKSPQAVAIVGAGPAGITIAMELEALGVESLLLEAGGFEFPDEEANDPYRGEVTGRPYSLDASRLRYFGGASNHWGGWCRPLDPEDFVKIDGRPLSGWPIDYNTAYEHLERAHELHGSGSRQHEAPSTSKIRPRDRNRHQNLHPSMKVNRNLHHMEIHKGVRPIGQCIRLPQTGPSRSFSTPGHRRAVGVRCAQPG